jgi:hypothetical protein
MKYNIIPLLIFRNVTISEFANMGAVVAHVQVDDGDTGQNGIVTCSIQNSYFQLQRIEVGCFPSPKHEQKQKLET